MPFSAYVCLSVGCSEGHKRVWEEAQVLHRDVSLSNILIKDKRENDDNDALGMLHDFDYSYIGPIGVNGNATKDVSNDRANTPRLHESIASNVSIYICRQSLTRLHRGRTSSSLWITSVWGRRIRIILIMT